MSSAQEQFKVEDFKVDYNPDGGLAQKYEELTKKKEVAVQPVQQVQPVSSKRIVRLKKIVECGCGDSFLELQREVDASDPLQDGDVVDSFKKGDRLAR